MHTNEPPYEELDHRTHDGVSVSLLWWPADDHVSVLVADGRSGATFELSVGDDSPLEVFHHPFAYAAFRGLAYDVAAAAN
jgi:hypothetical protein